MKASSFKWLHPSFAALCRVPMTAYPSVLQISAPDFAHLSKPTNEAERRGPEDVMIVMHHVISSTPTQSSEHDSPNQRAISGVI